MLSPSFTHSRVRSSAYKEASSVNDQHFNVFSRHFKDTLAELKVPADLAAEIMAAVEGARPEILNR